MRELDLVHVHLDDAVAVVVVDNPPVNALTNATIDALYDVGRKLAADDSVRVVALTGAGDKAFVAGADLEEFSGALGNRAWIEDHTARVRRMIDCWEQIAKPVVAAVQASAIGGGLELMLVCDLAVADPAALFALPEVRLGLMPGAGGTQRLPRRIGYGPANELLLLGLPVDATEAHRLGLINKVSAPGSAVEEARDFASKLADLSSVSLRAIKTSVGNAWDRNTDGLERERALFIDVLGSADAREGLTAFIEKRRPHFQHR